VKTHERLRKAKHQFEVETFDEAVRKLLEIHNRIKRDGRSDPL
jgi:hypothetical protein